MAIFFTIGSFIIFVLIGLAFYYLVERPKKENDVKSNIIQLQNDGFDFILYQGKVSEMMNDFHRYLGNMDITVYSKSVFIGFLEPKQTYLYLPAKAIRTVKYEANSITLFCFEELAGTKKVSLKSKSTKQLYQIAKKIDFISRRSKKVSAI